jgi:hypothetical protein
MSEGWQDHEEFIAKTYRGIRTKGSGSGVKEKGDVRIEAQDELVECKLAGEPGKPRRVTLVKQLEKVAQEAYEEGLDPVLALRYYDPTSTLAINGYVDIVVRLVRDDARRSETIGNGS